MVHLFMVVFLLELSGYFGHSVWTFQTGLPCAFHLGRYQSIVSLFCRWWPVPTSTLQKCFFSFHKKIFLAYTLFIFLNLLLHWENDIVTRYFLIWEYVLAVFLHECRNTHVISHMWKLVDSILKLVLPFHLFFFLAMIYLSCLCDAVHSILAGQ